MKINACILLQFANQRFPSSDKLQWRAGQPASQLASNLLGLLFLSGSRVTRCWDQNKSSLLIDCTQARAPKYHTTTRPLHSQFTLDRTNTSQRNKLTPIAQCIIQISIRLKRLNSKTDGLMQCEYSSSIEGQKCATSRKTANQLKWSSSNAMKLHLLSKHRLVFPFIGPKLASNLRLIYLPRVEPSKRDMTRMETRTCAPPSIKILLMSARRPSDKLAWYQNKLNQTCPQVSC